MKLSIERVESVSAQVSPTPWSYDGDHIRDQAGDIVATPDGDADAELIVHLRNNLPKFRRLIEAARDWKEMPESKEVERALVVAIENLP